MPSNGPVQPPPNPAREPIPVRHVGASQRRRMLNVLLTGRDAPNPAADQFLHFAREQRLALDNLWVAGRGDEPEAAALVVPSAGRTAMVFVSPMFRAELVPAAAAAVEAACGGLDPDKARLLQCLLEPSQQLEAQALQAAGFRYLAELLYMQASPRSGPTELDLGPDISLVHYRPDTRAVFADAILASYEQTLDCPGLLGLRHIDDILDSHIATGRFTPELWYALLVQDQPSGVMLLNELTGQTSLELVYLGLGVNLRGRGVAKRLLDHALAIADKRQMSQLVLAVDLLNQPAVRLYRRFGFVSTTRKTAMIKTLTP